MIIYDWDGERGWHGYAAWRDAFAEAMDSRLYTLDWLDRRILDGGARFWFTDRAAIVAELRHYPTGAADIHGLVAAGDLGDIVNVLIPAAEAWAQSIGCIGAVIESREGWAKVLRSRGYEPHQLTVRKEFA